MKRLKTWLALMTAAVLCVSCAFAAETVTIDDLLDDMLSAFTTPSAKATEQIDRDVEALDDPVLTAVAESWKTYYLNKELTVPLTEDTVFTRNTRVWAKTVKTDNIKIRLDVARYGSGKSKSIPEVLQVLPGQPVGTLPRPSWTGNGSEYREFLGWFEEDGTPVTAESTFAAETTIYAKWAEGYKITFADKDQPSFKAAYTGTDGKLDDLPDARRLVRGYPALGWYTAAGERVTADTVFTADTELTARWGFRILFHTERRAMPPKRSGT